MKRTKNGYRPLEHISMTELSELPYEEFRDMIRIPENWRMFRYERVNKHVKEGQFRENVIYSRNRSGEFFMWNSGKFLMLEHDPNVAHTISTRKLEFRNIFEMFYTNRHADWKLLFEIYKLRELL